MSRLPMLGERELVTRLREVGVAVAPADLQSPRAEDVCEWLKVLASKVLNSDMERLEQIPLAHLTEDNMAHVADLKIMLCSTLSLILESVGEDPLLGSMTQLCRPQPASLRKLLSVLLGLVALREEKRDFMDGLLKELSQREGENKQLEAQKVRLEERVRDGDARLAAQAATNAPLRAERNGLQKEVAERERKVAELEALCSAAERSIEDSEARLAARRDQTRKAAQDLAAKERKVVRNPGQMQADLVRLAQRLEDLEEEVKHATQAAEKERRKAQIFQDIQAALPAYWKSEAAQRSLLKELRELQHLSEQKAVELEEGGQTKEDGLASLHRLCQDLKSRQEAASKSEALHKAKMGRLQASLGELRRKAAAQSSHTSPTSSKAEAGLDGELAQLRSDLAETQRLHRDGLHRLHDAINNLAHQRLQVLRHSLHDPLPQPNIPDIIKAHGLVEG